MITWVLILTAYTTTFEVNQIEHIDGFNSKESCEVAGKTWQKTISEKNGLEFRTNYLCVKK